MKVTDIRIQIIKFSKNKLKAFSTVILDDSIVLKDLRIFKTERGEFDSMPSVKGQNGEWHEVVSFINTELKEQIENYVLRAYHDEQMKFLPFSEDAQPFLYEMNIDLLFLYKPSPQPYFQRKSFHFHTA